MEAYCGACDEFARISQLPALPAELRPVEESLIIITIGDLPQLVVYACASCGHQWTFNRADGAWLELTPIYA